MSARLVLFISGNGTNLQAVMDACENKELAASVVAVFSNKGDAYGLLRAHEAGIPAIHFQKLESESRRDYDARLAEAVLTYAPNYIVLAGWMRILTSAFLDRFPNRVINLHPALPGTFPGMYAIEEAYQAFQRKEIEHTGVMVHLVPDEGVDSGPVLASEIVPIQKNDTLDTLNIRIHEVEHILLVSALKNILAST
jgi:formyltetrahydrofolate-dependent phosphoribosylglycinamide formyltransferase